MLRSLLAVIVLVSQPHLAQAAVAGDESGDAGDRGVPGAAAQRAIPRVFVGEWRATILETRGDYGQWYRPGDTTDVLISRLGILRTLDGGGGQIHFLLHVPTKTARSDTGEQLVRVEAIRHLPYLGKDGKDEHVTITDRITDGDGVIEILVEIPEIGMMRMELSQILPRGIG